MPITIDASSAFALANDIRDLRANKIPQAKQRAIIALKRRIPVEARREIQEVYNLPASRIAAGLSATSDDTKVTLTGSGAGIGLISFGAKWAGSKSSGVIVSILKGDQKNFPHAFIAARRGSGQKPQVFERVGKSRLPLYRLFGPSIAQGLRRVDSKPELGDFAQEVLSNELNRNITLTK